jgi:hypothetical protein
VTDLPTSDRDDQQTPLKQYDSLKESQPEPERGFTPNSARNEHFISLIKRDDPILYKKIIGLD